MILVQGEEFGSEVTLLTRDSDRLGGNGVLLREKAGAAGRKSFGHRRRQ